MARKSQPAGLWSIHGLWLGAPWKEVTQLHGQPQQRESQVRRHYVGPDDLEDVTDRFEYGLLKVIFDRNKVIGLTGLSLERAGLSLLSGGESLQMLEATV